MCGDMNVRLGRRKIPKHFGRKQQLAHQSVHLRYSNGNKYRYIAHQFCAYDVKPERSACRSIPGFCENAQTCIVPIN